MNDPLYPNTMETEGELEQAHSDKAAGIFTEPSVTFAAAAKFPPRTIDWLLPLFIAILISVLFQFVAQNNPEVQRQMIDYQRGMTEKVYSALVEKGQMTEAEALQKLDEQEERARNAGTFGLIMSAIWIIVFTFIRFFIVAGIFLLLSKLMKGNGKYASSMVANGLPYYIVSLQIIVLTIITLAFSHFYLDTSVGALAKISKDTFGGFLLHKLDVFSIWFYAVVAIGLAKMFKSESVKKYYIMVFSVWLIWAFLMFGLSKLSPFTAGFVNFG